MIPEGMTVVLPGKARHKYVNGSPVAVEVVPYVGIDRRGRVGIGIDVPEMDPCFFGFLQPKWVIQSWRAMLFIQDHLLALDTNCIKQYYDFGGERLFSTEEELSTMAAASHGTLPALMHARHAVLQEFPEASLLKTMQDVATRQGIHFMLSEIDTARKKWESQQPGRHSASRANVNVRPGPPTPDPVHIPTIEALRRLIWPWKWLGISWLWSLLRHG